MGCDQPGAGRLKRDESDDALCFATIRLRTMESTMLLPSLQSSFRQTSCWLAIAEKDPYWTLRVGNHCAMTVRCDQKVAS